MIGFWSSAGYYLGTWDTLTNISQITFLDTNVPYVIPEIKQMPPADIINENGYIGANDITEFYSLVDTFYGADWYTTYPNNFFASSNSDDANYNDAVELYTAFLPGWDVGYKNTDAFSSTISFSDRGKYCFCIYIPKLKRIIISRGGPIIKKVEDDGTITELSNLPTPFFYTAFYYNSLSGSNKYLVRGHSYLIPALRKHFETMDDLTDYRNFAPIELAASLEEPPTSGYKYAIGVDIWNERDYHSYCNLFTLLFRDGTEPDFQGGEPPLPPPDNPYEPGGESKPGDLPPGTFDDTSDPIPDSPLPTLSAANTGFTRIYNPSLAQVQDLARYLWTDETVVQTIWNHIKQFFENPMEAIIGFNLVPVQVPDGGTQSFALMYIDTGVQMTVAANQFVDQDCGSVELKRYYGSALDQSPYTKVSCYLPFIGTVQLDTDEVMGTTLQVKYRVDIVSGSCVAKILVDGNVLYQYSGHCAINIPISSADFSSYVSAAISVAKLSIGYATGTAMEAVAASAADAAQETSNVTTRTTTVTDTTRNPATGRQITTGTHKTVETTEVPVDASSTRASFSGLSPANVSNTVGQIMGSKPHIEHTGSFSGNTGYLGVRRPFLIIERPNMCLPANYQTLNGYPAMITMSLGECHGYTRIQQVQLTGMSATNPEQAEILMLLKSGVVF